MRRVPLNCLRIGLSCSDSSKALLLWKLLPRWSISFLADPSELLSKSFCCVPVMSSVRSSLSSYRHWSAWEEGSWWSPLSRHLSSPLSSSCF